MDGASKLQLRGLRRDANFVLDTKDLGLCIMPIIVMECGDWKHSVTVTLPMIK